VAFCFKNLRRAWQGSIISREVLNQSSLDKMAGGGLEPFPTNIENCNMKRHSVKSAVGETVGISEHPPELQRVIDRWDTLPPEVKLAILALVKLAR
jgi:hypothetical protein